MLNGKKILLCVTGGIAVYKAAALTSKLTQASAEVRVIMSESAMRFVDPLTFKALSRHEVYFDTFDEKDASVIAHIDLADWADLVIIAPATANSIGKLANGIADNMITTTILATTAPVWIAPAMNVHMYDHPAVKRNIEILSSFGYKFIEPQEGYLACGYVGKGRLEEPEKIVKLLHSHFYQPRFLANKKILITAGPTREKIDPVRFFTNRSTGKMGYALAEVASDAGAEVTLITGPTSIPTPSNVKTIIRVESANEMYEQVIEYYSESDIVIKSAAVADYSPKITFNEKMKKQTGNLMIEMERTTDILKTLGEKKKHQLLIGFAAETNHIEEYAKKKLQSKNLDMIIANNVSEAGAGFGTDTNICTIFKRDNSCVELPLMSKFDVAKAILLEIKQLLPNDGENK